MPVRLASFVSTPAVASAGRVRRTMRRRRRGDQSARPRRRTDKLGAVPPVQCSLACNGAPRHEKEGRHASHTPAHGRARLRTPGPSRQTSHCWALCLALNYKLPRTLVGHSDRYAEAARPNSGRSAEQSHSECACGASSSYSHPTRAPKLKRAPVPAPAVSYAQLRDTLGWGCPGPSLRVLHALLPRRAGLQEDWPWRSAAHGLATP